MDETLAADRLLRYLLGDLSEPEQAELEDRYFRDDQAFAELLVAEDELIDAFVRGGLTRRQREQFEQHCLASPRQRERVEFARILIDFTAPRSPAAADVPAQAQVRSRWWESLRFPPVLQPAVLWSATAAIALLVLGGSWLVVSTLRLRNELERVQAERATFERQVAASERQIADERSRSDRLAVELQRERSERGTQAQELAKLQQSQPVVASFILTPGLVRDLTDAKRLVIPSGARLVQIQLDVTEAGYQRYRAVLENVAGDEIWSRDGLRADVAGPRKAVVLSIPSQFLPAGDYILKLSGVTPAGSLEDVDEYYFRVVRR